MNYDTRCSGQYSKRIPPKTKQKLLLEVT
jgi:hypothetical protein